MLTSHHAILCARAAGRDLVLLPRMANRHGLITGATGTGKTVTLQGLAEGFSQLGVPVFLADVKGDLSGLAQAGKPEGKIASRIKELQLEAQGYTSNSFPVCFWDVYGEEGHPLRTTISELGPLILARLLKANAVQSGVLQLAFRIADDNGWLILDLKDLRSILTYLADERKNLETSYGHIATQSVGALQRSLLELESQGGELFFGEPALRLDDLLTTDAWGNGIISILSVRRLINEAPLTYSSLLLWLLTELFEQLPEVGDTELPRLVFFFDEAHLLFDHAEPALLEKIEQLVRLIRSRAVGIYFVSQSPSDLPDSILGQLGNRIQHALRAFTPKERKALKAAADSFRPNPAFNSLEVLESLGVGEALISFLDEDGVPAMVERGLVLPPESRVGPISKQERDAILSTSTLAGIYDQAVDRVSAFEMLKARAEKSTAQTKPAQTPADENLLESVFGSFAKQAGQQITRQISREIGRTLVRGVFGTLFGKKR